MFEILSHDLAHYDIYVLNLGYPNNSGNEKPNNFVCYLSDVLRHLVPFVQFKKREKHPWRSVPFSKVAGF